MLGDNGLGIFRLDIAVPDGVRINHNHRPVFALVQTSGFVDANPSREPCVFRQLLKAGMQIALAVAGTGGTRRLRGANVVTDKDMMFKSGQGINPPGCGPDFRLKPWAGENEVSTSSAPNPPASARMIA
jgi:hypothetical protein